MGKKDLITPHPITKRTHEQLKRIQSRTLEQKVNLSLRRIMKFYEYMEGNVYVSLSGKDSTVLLHLVRSLYPEVPAVFSDTGLEFPEIREFIKTVKNVIWLKPEKTFKKVLKDHGFPVVSKEVSRYVSDLQNPTEKNEKTRRIRLEGSAFKGGKSSTGMLSKKWRFLIDSPFKCSNKCCDIMKKKPFKIYERETGRKPYVGIMASESRLRMQSYLSNGCNVFENGKIQSRPISFWTEKDVWDYIRSRNIPYSKIYDMGYERTGCIFCMFGHWQSEVDRFALLKKTHPKQYKYCMEKLGLKDVIDYIDKHVDRPNKRDQKGLFGEDYHE